MELFSKRFMKYLFVGGFCFFIDYGFSLIFFNLIGLSAIKSNTLSVIIATVIKFYINKKFTFNNLSSKIKTQMLMSFIVLIIYLGITNALVYLFSDIAGISYNIAKPIVVFLGVFANYFLDKHLTFSKRTDK